MDFKEALAVFKKYEEEERNWRSARQKITELLETVERADAVMREHLRQKGELEASLARLASEEATLRTSVANFTKKLSTLKADFTAREAPKLEELAALDRQIGEKREQLAAVKAELEAFKSRLTV